MNRNVILLTQFALVYLLTIFLQLLSLEKVCIHKLYIVYFEISVMLIGHVFSFFGHGKIMENRCWKRGGTLMWPADLVRAGLQISVIPARLC